MILHFTGEIIISKNNTFVFIIIYGTVTYSNNESCGSKDCTKKTKLTEKLGIYNVFGEEAIIGKESKTKMVASEFTKALILNWNILLRTFDASDILTSIRSNALLLWRQRDLNNDCKKTCTECMKSNQNKKQKKKAPAKKKKVADPTEMNDKKDSLIHDSNYNINFDVSDGHCSIVFCR